MNRSLLGAFLLIPLVLVCFAFLPQARAVCQDACLTDHNTVHGDDALINLTTGFGNTAIGFETLSSNTTGGFNTAIGDQTLSSNTTGVFNTAIGNQTLSMNIDGSFNTAVGFWALLNNTRGTLNTAIGNQALLNNTSGSSSTAIGQSALLSLTTGLGNTAIGDSALYNNKLGSRNIAVGAFAGNAIKGSDNIDIGNQGNRNDLSTIRIGTTGTQTSTFIAGISGVTIADGVGVVVGADGHLGTVVSSERYKDSIKPMDKASEAIFALKPVTFRYKHELDPEGIPQFGLVAEQVEKVNPDLVARDEEGKAYTVRYEAVNAMLLNEFLKAHRKIEEQERRARQQDSTVAELRSQVQALTAALKEQSLQIQKVSARLELNKSALQTVLNNQ